MKYENTTNRRQQKDAADKPENYTPMASAASPFTSVNPCDKHERLYNWERKRADSNFYAGYIFDNKDETK